MLNEAVKKQLLSSEEYFKAKRWEGKPLKFKFKYAFANYPELLICGIVVLGIAPVISAYKYFTFDNSKRDVIKKFKPSYTGKFGVNTSSIVRDDDPQLDRILAEKKLGKEYFPE